MNQYQSTPQSPHDEYQRRLQTARDALATLNARERNLANARLGVFTVGAILGWVAFGLERLSAWWLVLPALGFATLVVAFDRATREGRRAARRVAYYERGLDRLEDRWAGKGETGSRFRNPEHPYAEDLDLFGPGSLFERISTARTRAGEETLAAWLLAGASPEVILDRQAAVAELRPKLDLREDVALLGGEVGTGTAFEGLAEWGAEPRRLDSTAARVAAAVLSVLALPALFGWLVFQIGMIPLLIVAALEGALALFYLKRVRSVLATVERRSGELEHLSDLLARLEREPFHSPELARLRTAIETDGRPASRRIDDLRRLVATLDARRNMLLAPFSPLLLWGTQIAFAIEAWRASSGPAIAGWLAAIGEIEALDSLAAFAFENPDDVVPEIVTEGGPLFEAEAIGHPLLPVTRVVRNDVQLGGELRVLVVSGSNMSGKSTLLRAIGTNVVLAMAGATVRASRLRLSPLTLGATLRVQDSLQAGRSRFYAEILRLRQLLDLARGPVPLLFLLDEILHGTNSHDRCLGAEAVVVGLIDRGAIGLVTTHDLALADIAGRLAPRARNVHFADHFENGKMIFDYQMRPGIVQHSNALALMRSVGLDV